jgi:hypothetical protein
LGPVLWGAWEKTRNPLGWDRKKVGIALISVGTVITTGLQFGWLAMIQSGAGIFWLAFPPAFAAVILFVWGMIETQAKLYAELAQTTSVKIAGLETEISAFKHPPPDYEAWRHKNLIDLRTAAFLWCDEAPGMSMSKKVTQWYHALSGAIQEGKLDFVPQLAGASMREHQIRVQKDNPNLNTLVTRDRLRDFAKANGYDPIFLREV